MKPTDIEKYKYYKLTLKKFLSYRLLTHDKIKMGSHLFLFFLTRINASLILEFFVFYATTTSVTYPNASEFK